MNTLVTDTAECRNASHVTGLLDAMDCLNKIQAKVDFISIATNFKTLGEDTTCIHGLQFFLADINDQIESSIVLIDNYATSYYRKHTQQDHTAV